MDENMSREMNYLSEFIESVGCFWISLVITIPVRLN